VRFRALPAAATALTITATLVVYPAPANADRFRNDEWHIPALKVAEANKISSGRGVVVAVIDTGVYPHADLSRNLLRGTSLIGGSDPTGRADPNGHGTKMASLIAAHGRPNGAGVVGIAPEAKILPVRDSDDEGRGDSISAGKAIEWASDHGAKIINFSGATAPSRSLQNGITAAAEKDALVVAASGNVGQDVAAAYPAAMPGVLAVGASDRSGRHSAGSVPTKEIQLCAPGVDIEGAKPPNRYSIGDGTSDSTAIVSGAAALVRAKFPQLSAPEVIHRLTATATDIGKPGRDDECGYGLLNIVKALTADVPPLQPAGSAGAASPTPTSSTPQAAAPDTKPTGNTLPAVVGSVVAVLLIGGLVVFLTIRRRKTS
jgi:type VII secretion-associated serine protease mycosin